jgi:hypothetical protein
MLRIIGDSPGTNAQYASVEKLKRREKTRLAARIRSSDGAILRFFVSLSPASPAGAR